MNMSTFGWLCMWAVVCVTMCPAIMAGPVGGDVTSTEELRELARKLDVLLQRRDLDDSHDGPGDLDTHQHYSFLDTTDDVIEEFDLELENDRQIVTLATGGAAGSRLVIDGNKGIISWANSETDECYLIGGVDADIPDAKTLNDGLSLGASRQLSLNQILYQKVRSRVWRDTSVLADEVQDQCQDKPIFWLEKVNSDTAETQGRKRRQAQDNIFAVSCLHVICGLVGDREIPAKRDTLAIDRRQWSIGGSIGYRRGGWSGSVNIGYTWG